MKKYLITGNKRNVQVVLGYNSAGLLVLWEILGEANAEQANWCRSVAAANEEQLLEYRKRGLQVDVLMEDLSFETFWTRYGYKVKRARAEKVWEKMPMEVRLKAMLGIARYDKHLRMTGQAKAHPNTYLQDRRWEDEY